MYVILDSQLKRLASLDVHTDNNHFWGETIERQIADTDTENDELAGVDTFNSTDPNANSKSWNDVITGLTMPASEPAAGYLKEGNHIAVYDSVADHWRLYRIHTVTESIDQTSGTHLVSADAVNLAIWKLGKTVPAKKEIKECKLSEAMQWIMADTGWDLDNNATSGLFADINFDGTTTSQAMLQTVLSTYDCEADAYCTFDSSGLVSDLILELTDELGENTGKSISYGRNATTIQRQTVDTTLVTKLYVYGPDGVSIGDVNNGHNFVTDGTANALYNHDQNTWLEGTITSETIKEPKALLEWGMKQLRIFNHPRINYTVEASQDFNPNLGDTIKVIDLTMLPQLTVQARVIDKVESESDPSQNKITLGEFATVTVVTPGFIKNMEERWADHVKKLFEDARKNSSAASVSLITPLGASWNDTDTKKDIIARLFIEGENVTSFLSTAAFNWQKINTDGTHDTDWEDEHAKDGYEVTITPPFVGTLLVQIDDTFVKDEAEIWVDTDVKAGPDGVFPKLWESKESRDQWGNGHVGALQYSIILSGGNVLSSYAYGKTGKTLPNESSLSDTEYLKFDSNGIVTDAMIVQGGGHGSSFSYDEGSNTIYSIIRDSDKKYYLCTFPFQSGAVINASSVTKWCEVKKFYRCCVDLEQQLWLGSDTAGNVVICRIPDLQAGNWQPNIEFSLKDFGWNPLLAGTTNDGSFNTLQANGFHYPYAFFTAGDVNNADPRIVMGVNVITHSMEFGYELGAMQDIKLDIPLEYGGHFEPEGVYYDDANSRLIVGINISEWTDAGNTTAVAHSALFEMPIGQRDDSKDLATEYPVEDESTVDTEKPTAVDINGGQAADIEDSDNISDSNDDFNAADPTGEIEVNEP